MIRRVVLVSILAATVGLACADEEELPPADHADLPVAEARKPGAADSKIPPNPPPALPPNDTRPVTEVVQMAAFPPSALAGRSVEFDDVLVVELVKGLGFWVQGATNERVFVVPSRANDEPRVSERRVSIDGIVMHTTPAMQERLTTGGAQAPPVYVLAWAITG